MMGAGVTFEEARKATAPVASPVTTPTTGLEIIQAASQGAQN
jgi:hypothetical protein